MNYEIIYSPEALDDLRSIYMYIAYELLAGETSSALDLSRLFPVRHLCCLTGFFI